jgi:hypothetical protein
MLVAIPTAAAIAFAFAASPSIARFAASNGGGGGGATCKGGTSTNPTIWSTNVSGNLTIASGAYCVVTAVNIANSIIVDSKATLIDKGASVSNSITATSASGIGIGGASSTQPGFVGQSISISGTTGSGPGTVDMGSNYLCNTNVAGSAQITGTATGAGQWIIGDRDEDCSNGANQITNNLTVTNNKVRVDISDNEEGPFPYSVGIDQSLLVTGNLVTTTAPYAPVVESNFIGQAATCQTGTRMDGDGTKNIVEQGNSGCP